VTSGARSGGTPTLAETALATCSQLPNLDDDERLVVRALADLGVEAVPAVWDDPAVDWQSFRVVVIRSTWDYAERRDEYLEWCASLSCVLNPFPVIWWNTDKRYLRDLAAAGIPIVPTTWVDPSAPVEGIELPDGELVVKPAVSAGARNTSRYRSGDADGARAHIARLVGTGRTAMIQPYVHSVDRNGETGLIYFDGRLSHSIRKGPLLRTHGHVTTGLWEPEDITPRDPDPDEVALAERTLDALPWSREELLYARVDVVRTSDGAPMLLELEVTEPSLFLALGDGAAARLASAIARRLHA
jgi:glutathione synthase/RimK-type ligase-like ATP-grasp enzyme